LVDGLVLQPTVLAQIEAKYYWNIQQQVCIQFFFFSLEASGSCLGSVFGEAGHHCDVNFLFGWPLTTVVGLPIAWPSVGFLAQ